MAGPSNEQWRCLLQTSIHQTSENPISCLKFDKYEELLWCATATGKVSSYSPATNFNRYTAFVVNRRESVNALETTEPGIFALTNTSLKLNSRQGIAISKYTSASMTKTTAMYRMPGSSIFVIGGPQNKILQYDFVKEKEIRTTEMAENGAIIIRYNGQNNFTADNNGFVTVRSPKTLGVVHTLACHGDRITDFDVQGNKLITCGFSQRFKTSHGDPFLKVYDLRTYKALSPIPLAFAPMFSRFMPSYCERIVVVSQSGGVRIADMNSNSIGTNLILETPGVTAFDFSSTKNYLAFGDFTGGYSLYIDRETPLINENSYETQFATPLVGPPVSFSIEDANTSLAIVPNPISADDWLLSDWPTELTEPKYRKMKPMSEQSEKKVMHYVTQVKNPRINTKLKHFNVVPYILDEEPPAVNAPPPVKPSHGKAKVSKIYRMKEIPTSVVARRPEEKGSKAYNPSKHVTIESTYYMNMIVNPFVLALYDSIPLRNLIYSHVCLNENCTACQLRFLFMMMTDCKDDERIESKNLIMTMVANGFRTNKLDVLGSMKLALDHLVEAVTVLSGFLNTSLDDCLLSEMEKGFLRTNLSMTERCVRCGALQSTVPAAEHSISLGYPFERAGSSPTFCQLIEKALHLGSGNVNNGEERECEECKANSRMESKRKVSSIAPCLMIDTNVLHPHFFEFWQRQLNVYERKPVGGSPDDSDSDGEKKNCRYGDECRNKKSCKFAHGNVDWEHESALLLEKVEMEGWAHYVPARFSAQVNDGIVRLSDISECPEYDEPNTKIYELTAMVVAVGDGNLASNWSHSVTFVKDKQKKDGWLLTNEQLVCGVHEHEALHMDIRWKLPMFLIYRWRDWTNEKEEVEVRTEIPETMFFLHDNLATNEMTSSGSVEKFELPGRGELVAIDAEFVEIRAARFNNEKKTIAMKAIGRVSCIDSTGTRIILDDHVRIDKEEIENYLSMYSGIEEYDLDEARSKKYLTTLKRVYLKVMILVQRGCIFVGHALNNDFSVLNMHVPEKQVLDTVKLFRLDSHRMLSLQFLCFELLGDLIQNTPGHDSVVDAKTALACYRKYSKLLESGELDKEIVRIYTKNNSNSPNRNPAVVHISASQPALASSK